MSCVYIAAVGEMVVVGVYVDDIVVACKSEAKLKEFKQALCRKFDVKDLGKLHHFLFKMRCQVMFGLVSQGMLARGLACRRPRALLLLWMQALNS